MDRKRLGKEDIVMKCPCCGKELEKGKISCLPMQGFGTFMMSYVSEEEAKKSFFKRETCDKIIGLGDEMEGYYCSECKKMMPIIDIE